MKRDGVSVISLHSQCSDLEKTSINLRGKPTSQGILFCAFENLVLQTLPPNLPQSTFAGKSFVLRQGGLSCRCIIFLSWAPFALETAQTPCMVLTNQVSSFQPRFHCQQTHGTHAHFHSGCAHPAHCTACGSIARTQSFGYRVGSFHTSSRLCRVRVLAESGKQVVQGTQLTSRFKTGENFSKPCRNVG